jgi:hypothetical protein
MPNWKKLIVSGSDAALNSLNVTSALTASGNIYPTGSGVDRQVLKTDGLGNITFGYPEEVTAIVKNISGNTLLKGTPVHATSSGAMGNIVGVIAALASDASTMPATFVLNETLANEAEGEALAVGFIQGVDTSTFEVGQVVYVGSNGGYVGTKPTGSNLIQNLGIVTKVNAVNGSGYVLGAGRSNDIPNIQPGHLWVGNSNSVATPTATSSLNVSSSISASYAETASYSNDFTIGVAYLSSSIIESSIVGSNTIVSFPTGSYNSAFFKYVILSGSNARSGEILSVWNQSSIEYTEYSTRDIGNTSLITSSITLSGPDVNFNININTAGWMIKTITTLL